MRMIVGLSIGLCAAGGFAQAPDTVIRTTTRLIEITVVAHDGHGASIGDLREEDFEVFDNGKPRPIRVFTVNQSQPPPAPLPPHTFTNQAAPGSATAYSVLLLDWANTEWGDQAQARQKALRTLQHVNRGDNVALYVLSNRLRPIHEFTSNMDALARALAALRGQPPDLPVGGAQSPYAASNARVNHDLSGPPPHDGLTGRQRAILLERRVANTLEAFEEIAAHLRDVPGRKSLIWVTAGFPTASEDLNFGPEIERAMRRLDNANITVYPVDARGLLAGSGALVNIETMRLFADLTGGLAYYNRNDLDTAIQEAIDDLRVSYTLGFYQPDGPGAAGLHEIRVRSRRPGTSLRYRQSYGSDLPPRQSAPEGAAAEMNQALLRPSDETAIPMTVTALRRQDRLTLQFRLGAQALTLVENRGRWQGHLQLLARFETADGTQTDSVSSTQIAANLREATYKEALRSGFALQLDYRVPPKATGLRILVRDSSSGRIGTLSFPLED